MITVSFKHEGTNEKAGLRFGPVVVTDTDAYDADPVVAERRAAGAIGLPFGYKPAGVTNLGWLTEPEAEAIAAEHGVTLTRW